MRILPGLLLLCATACLSLPAQAAGLKPPFAVPANPPVSKGKALKPCPTAPAPVIDLNFQSIYEEDDPTASTVDPKAEAAYKRDIVPIHRFETENAKRANNYIRTEGADYSSAACALQWMSEWAAAGALTGTATRQGESVRKWSLASFSSAYLQFGADRRLSSTQKLAVKKWLYKLSKMVMSDYSRNTDLSSRRNNHVYWAALAVGMTGIVLQQQDQFDWAMAKARVGLVQVQDDGTLPLEMRRAKRAQMYHLFATVPLVVLAEMGRVNDVNLYSYNKGALNRLVKMNIMQLAHPDYMEHRAGAKQTIIEENLPMLLSWIEPYNKRYSFSDADLANEVAELLKEYQPFFNRRIGGSATLLYGEPVKPKPKS